MPYIEIDEIVTRGAKEWTYRMAVIGDDGDYARDLAGRRITEHFGSPRIYRNMLLDEDFLPQHRASHHCDAAYTAGRMQRGGNDRPFVIERDGTFLDYHGGAGVPEACVQTWFTPEALRRGVGWTFIQTYKLDGTRIGRFHVSRIVTSGSPYRLRVIKRRV